MNAVLLEAVEGGLEHGGGPLLRHLGRDGRRGREGTHAARVGALVLRAPNTGTRHASVSNA